MCDVSTGSASQWGRQGLCCAVWMLWCPSVWGESILDLQRCSSAPARSTAGGRGALPVCLKSVRSVVYSGFCHCSFSSGQVHLMDECKGRANPSLLYVYLHPVLQCTGPTWLLDSPQSAGPAGAAGTGGWAGQTQPCPWMASPGGGTCLASLSWVVEGKSPPCGPLSFNLVETLCQSCPGCEM